MKSLDIFSAINNIDDAFISEADNYKKAARFPAKRIIAAAACALICITAFYFINSQTFGTQPFALEQKPLQQAPYNDSLPKITAKQSSGAMGFEGYLIKNASDLDSANPWTPDMKLDTLPVFVNAKMQLNENNRLDIESDESIIARAEKLWNEFDAGEYEIKITRSPSGVPEEEMDVFIKSCLEKGNVPIPGIFGYTDVELTNGKLTVSANSINTSLHASMPIQNSFITNMLFNEGQYKSYVLQWGGAAYLKQKYANILKGYETEITGQTYSFPSENNASRKMYNSIYYMGGKTDEEKILNYAFKRRTAYIHAEEGLFGMWENSVDLSSKLGDYPIISTEEALTLLYEGDYLTTVPHEITSADKTVKAELIYRSASYDPLYLPYYKFYVDLENDKDIYTQDGFMHVGAYYVPAVEPQYLDDKLLGITFNGSVITK